MNSGRYPGSCLKVGEPACKPGVQDVLYSRLGFLICTRSSNPCLALCLRSQTMVCHKSGNHSLAGLAQGQDDLQIIYSVAIHNELLYLNHIRDIQLLGHRKAGQSSTNVCRAHFAQHAGLVLHPRKQGKSLRHWQQF